ncbi:hypothetical protein FHS43_003216 [Streptosporangium becharense]|uniref:Uncharacterized protein n=1 Tax=Streptosporangium becharense TaxID=1816182 RepID=A0A7W9IE88_9ACTN|nr:hypothetical protein [Streptosporangium becharense]MBB2911936.1 hypothetical protein [Streptosporangium becharense]MBB5818483.1 hypothetical protein [Streptosporangium becharense]
MILLISVYIDLAIGLVLAFLLLSLLVSGVNEGIVRLLGIRSKFLWAYLRDTLDGGSADGGSWIPARIADVFARLPFSRRDPRPVHSPDPAPAVVEPVPVEPLSADPVPAGPLSADPVSANPAGDRPGPEAGSVSPVDMTARLYERLQEIDHPKGARTSIAYIPPERFSGAVLELVAAEGDGVEGLLAKLEAVGSPLAGHLRGVWEGAQRDMQRFRKGVESWFDGEMQRLSGLYARYVRWVLLALGVLLTLLFSMDSLEYGKTLLRDNAYRAGVVAIAGGGQEGYAALRDRCAGGGTGPAEPYACVTEALSSPALVKIFDHAVVSVAIPPEGSGGPSFRWNGAAWWDRLTTAGHWPGYLVTVVALLFGASFWWDVLRRLTGVRGHRP